LEIDSAAAARLSPLMNKEYYRAAARLKSLRCDHFALIATNETRKDGSKTAHGTCQAVKKVKKNQIIAIDKVTIWPLNTFIS
jgi:hypothetical protein